MAELLSFDKFSVTVFHGEGGRTCSVTFSEISGPNYTKFCEVSHRLRTAAFYVAALVDYVGGLMNGSQGWNWKKELPVWNIVPFPALLPFRFHLLSLPSLPFPPFICVPSLNRGPCPRSSLGVWAAVWDCELLQRSVRSKRRSIFMTGSRQHMLLVHLNIKHLVYMHIGVYVALTNSSDTFWVENHTLLDSTFTSIVIHYCSCDIPVWCFSEKKLRYGFEPARKFRYGIPLSAMTVAAILWIPCWKHYAITVVQ